MKTIILTTGTTSAMRLNKITNKIVTAFQQKAAHAGIRRTAILFAALLGMLGAPSAFALTAQTITGFAPATPITYSPGSKFKLSATGGASKNKVVFASSTPAVCGVSNDKVNVLAAGACTLTANQAGDANYSPAPQVTATVIINKASQSINFASLSGKTFGMAPFTVSSKASSGLVVAFSSMTAPVCAVAGNTVTLLAAGTCTIAANQAGNGNYNAAPQVTQAFAVAKGSQSIAFAALTNKTYGGASFTVAASATSGLPVAFNSLTAPVCAVAGDTVALLAAGTCAIAANQAGNANYNPAPQVSKSFTVAKASQVISFGTIATQNVGTPLTLSATASSGLAVTFASSTSKICTVSGTTATFVKMGTCTIVASQAGNANYAAAANVSQSFTVAAALIPQVITGFAPASPITYSPGLTFVLTATGGGSGNVVTFASTTTGICTVAGSTVAVLSAGTCTLTANQAGNTIYKAAPQVTANVLITPGSQTISFGALANQRIGAAAFPISATATSGLSVTFTSGTPSICSLTGISGNSVSVAALGTCTVNANQSGNGNYNPAPQVAQSFLVGQAAIVMAIGDAHACALTNAGGAQCWGANNLGQLGDGSTIDRTTPVDVTGLTSGVAAVEAGVAHSCAITATGAAKCWGNNDAGQLGNNSTSPSAAPVDVLGLSSNVIALSLGQQHSCALLGSGDVQCWGANNWGQLGDGSMLQRLTPVTVQGLSAGIVDVRGGDNHSCAIAGSGTVQCWGRNDDGQLGDGTANLAATPVTVSGLATTRTVDGAGRHTCAVNNAGGVQCWGNNSVGQLGNGGTTSSLTPVAVSTLTSGVSAIAASNDASCAVTAGGVQCWGAGFTNTPQAVPGATTGMIDVGNGNGSTCSITTGSALLCWGANARGQLGDGTTVSRSTPAFVSKFSGGNAANQSITFGALANQNMGGAPVTLSASASSGLPVVFTSITNAVCTVSGNTVTLVSAGSCTIAANQTGNGSFNAAQQVTQSFLINLNAQAITGFAPATPIPYSAGQTFALSATGGASSNPVTFASSTTNICTVAGNTATIVSGGACTLTANQLGNANYSAAPQVTATVVITPINQSISFAPLVGKSVGDAAFTVSATASSGLTVAFSSTTLTVCTVSSGIVTIVAAGTCSIAADQGGDSNYNVAPTITQSFSVALGLQVISGFAPVSPVPFVPGGTVALAATGGASGNSVTFGSTTPAVCTVAGGLATIVSGGSCMVTADQAGNAGYAAAPQVTAAIVITPAAQTISFDPVADQTMGAGPVALVASASSGLPVVFGSATSATCTVAGGSVTLVSAGTCTVTANQAGNASYSAAPTLTQSFAIAPAVPLGPQVYYIHSDHLNSPRMITDVNNNVVWKWGNDEVFGSNAPNQNPSGLGTFTYNSRFPGQYFDQETGLHYNMNRNYDPQTGRYLESDPIGLIAGLNTYTYVKDNPISRDDPLGLWDMGGGEGGGGKCYLKDKTIIWSIVSYFVTEDVYATCFYACPLGTCPETFSEKLLLVKVNRFRWLGWSPCPPTIPF